MTLTLAKKMMRGLQAGQTLLLPCSDAAICRDLLGMIKRNARYRFLEVRNEKGQLKIWVKRQN